VRNTEKCGALSPQSILISKNKRLAGFCRIVERKLCETGASFQGATVGCMSMTANVPDGVPKPKLGDGVLFQKNASYFSGFDPAHSVPDTEINNAVVAKFR